MGIFDIFKKKKAKEENIVEEINYQEKKIEEIKIISFLSVNELKYGIHRNEVWEEFGKPQESFFKNADDYAETDVYECFHVYYDENYNPDKRKHSRRDLFEYQPSSGTRISFEYALKKCSVINVKNI